MRAAVVTFPGSNCDRDLAVAIRDVTGADMLRIWHADTELPSVDLIALPGGFSYGDYLRCGAVAARSPIMSEVIRRADKGVAILGICNGFQILTESGLLPGAMIRNAGLAFVCREVALRVGTDASAFTSRYGRGREIRLPVAHHDGNFVADGDAVARLEDEDRIAFRYVDNPNGAVADIAGVMNAGRNVLGMMPHPERACDPLHGGTDGKALFQSLLEALG